MTIFKNKPRSWHLARAPLWLARGFISLPRGARCSRCTVVIAWCRSLWPSVVGALFHPKHIASAASMTGHVAFKHSRILVVGHIVDLKDCAATNRTRNPCGLVFREQTSCFDPFQWHAFHGRPICLRSQLLPPAQQNQRQLWFLLWLAPGKRPQPLDWCSVCKVHDTRFAEVHWLK